MLKLTNICHSFGDKKVLEGIGLTLLPGQRIALMGPSGTGKTTVLRIAAGILKPSSGSVENTFRKTAVVFQEPRLLPWRTAAENVNLVLRDSRETLETAKSHLKQVGLAADWDKYPAQLSGGMQQRVALARALAAGGDLLVLDEPFKAMDETLRYQVIGTVAQTKAAVLLVTHDAEEARALGCEIVKL
ncbi:MAG: ABC transporter ATP-binding protein [Oscillospiraceae bacterium]|nr:ABC transporter ATP-binding protein [Oscillospiraceae bacterium]